MALCAPSSHPCLSVIKEDVKDTTLLQQTMVGHEVVIPLAANANIVRSVEEPSLDFVEGFYLTYAVLESMRKADIKHLIYLSGSGVYGDRGTMPCFEQQEE